MLQRILILFSTVFLLAGCGEGDFSASSTSILSALEVEGAALSPEFRKNEHQYVLTLTDPDKPISVVPTPAHDLATVTLNGQPLANGKKSAPIAVTDTPYEITLKVVSPDQKRYSEYKLVVIRAGETPPNANDTNDTLAEDQPVESGEVVLRDLRVSPATLIQPFDPKSNSYDAAVGHLVAAVTVTAPPTDTTAIVTINGIKTTAPAYSTEVALKEGSNEIDIRVASADGHTSQNYRLIINRASAATLTQGSLLTMPKAQTGADFGFAIATDGHYAAISAPDASSGKKSKAGIVYLFEYIDASWIASGALVAPSPRKDDRFGYSIAIEGNTLAISSFGDDTKKDDSGAVHIYQRDGNVWTHQQTLYSPEPVRREHFGYNVALSGEHLAIATLRGPDGASSGGDVYLFQHGQEQWELMQKIEIAGASDRFGRSIALQDSLLAIGYFAADDECRSDNGDPGKVTLFRLNNGNWNQEAILEANNGDGADRFGFSVALSTNKVAVSAICEDSTSQSDPNNNGTQAGAVYVFATTGDRWQQQAYIKEPKLRSHNLFGFRIALQNGLLAAAAPLHDTPAEDAGAVYLYQSKGDQWEVLHTLQPNDVAKEDEFGVDMALRGEHLLIGAAQPRQGKPDSSGKVYSYH